MKRPSHLLEYRRAAAAVPERRSVRWVRRDEELPAPRLPAMTVALTSLRRPLRPQPKPAAPTVAYFPTRRPIASRFLSERDQSRQRVWIIVPWPETSPLPLGEWMLR